MITLEPLKTEDREQFIKENQEAFNYGALEEFGRRDDHFEEDDQIISRETIIKFIEAGDAYRILLNEESVGGLIIKVDGARGELDILFVSPKAHSKGIGYQAWCEVEKKLSEAPMPDEDAMSPWVGEVPDLSVYDWRGCRMLATASWKSKCFKCKRAVRPFPSSNGCRPCFLEERLLS